MISFWQLPSRYILKNKEKSLAIIVSIVVSIALITSVFIIKDHLSEMRSEMAVNKSGGNYDIRYSVPTISVAEKITKDDIIANISLVFPWGKAVLNDDLSLLDINGYGEDIFDYINFTNFEGKFPTEDNEIAIERWALELLEEKCDIGDTVTLQTYIQSPFRTDNSKFERENTFKIVGIFDYTNEMSGFQNVAQAIVAKDFAYKERPLAKYYWYDGYLMLKDKYSIFNGNQLLSVTNEYKDASFSINNYKNMLPRMNDSDNRICSLMFFIIIIVTSVVIFNTYNVIVAERKKDFGILRATGASPMQIKLLVILEGFILGIIFIPIGILLGGIVTKFLLLKFTGATVITGLLNIPRDAIVYSFIIGFVFIFLGAYVPARKASIVSPMVAITSVDAEEYNRKRKQISLEDINKLSKKVDINYNIAKINIERSKKRFITTVVSLTISIILFITISYIIKSTDTVTILKENKTGDITLSSNSLLGVSEKALNKIEDIDGVNVEVKRQCWSADMFLEPIQVSGAGNEYYTSLATNNEYLSNLLSKQIYCASTKVYGYSEEDIKEIEKYKIEGNIDIDKMNEINEVAIIESVQDNEYLRIVPGDKIKLSVYTINELGEIQGTKVIQVTVGAIIDEKAIQDDLDNGLNNALIITNEGFENIFPNLGYTSVSLSIPKEGDMAEYKTMLQEKLAIYKGITISTFEEQLNSAKAQSFTIRGTLYTFLGLIAFVSIVNLFQVMKMNVLLRRNEIGMLRAIGQSNSDVRKMILKEGYIYAIVSYVIGGLMGTLITLILYSRRILFGINITWIFPFLDLLMVLIVVGTITFLASIWAVRKILKKSIIESIRSVE